MLFRIILRYKCRSALELSQYPKSGILILPVIKKLSFICIEPELNAYYFLSYFYVNYGKDVQVNCR